MPYNEACAARIRSLADHTYAFEEKRMFGGIGFLLKGNMCCGVWKDNLILRVGKDTYEDALNSPCTAEFDITGRPMRGWVMVDPQGYESHEQLTSWVQRAVDFTETLPAK